MKNRYMQYNGLSEHDFELYYEYRQGDKEIMEQRWRDFALNVNFGDFAQKALAEKMFKYGYMAANFERNDETTEEN